MTDQPNLADQLDALSESALLEELNATLSRRRQPQAPGEAQPDDDGYEDFYPNVPASPPPPDQLEAADIEGLRRRSYSDYYPAKKDNS